jgi:hypothetical protein
LPLNAQLHSLHAHRRQLLHHIFRLKSYCFT